MASVRFVLQVVTFCKSTDGLICALGSRDRYRLSVLVEQDEETGLSPSFCTYTLYTYLISSTRKGLHPRTNSRASE